MTDNDIIKALEWLILNFPKQIPAKDDTDRLCNCINLYCQNAVDELNRQKAQNERDIKEKVEALYKVNDLKLENERLKAEIERLEYTLLGVMHSVDKWLDGDELEQDEVNRAITMREKTLQIVEMKQAEIERLSTSLVEWKISALKKADRVDELEREKSHLIYSSMIGTTRAEAITEFAVRLKENAKMGKGYLGNVYHTVDVCYIDQIAKEMIEGVNNER